MNQHIAKETKKTISVNMITAENDYKPVKKLTTFHFTHLRKSIGISSKLLHYT